VWNAPDRRLRVTVVDALHEEPIPGARVTLLSGDAVEGDPTTDQPRTPLYATDNHGRCHELWLRAGKAIIVVVARGKAPVRLPVELRDGDPQPREVRVQVEPGRHVEGKVVDGKGRPVAGVRVAPLIGFWAAYDEGGATTDAEGKFALDALPAEGGFVGVVDKDGMVDARTAATARDLVLVTGRGP
jgi:hypothetical protein